MAALVMEEECVSCDEGYSEPEAQCPSSRRPCGHHCNHVWTHDQCDWCGKKYEGEL